MKTACLPQHTHTHCTTPHTTQTTHTHTHSRSCPHRTPDFATHIENAFHIILNGSVQIETIKMLQENMKEFLEVGSHFL